MKPAPNKSSFLSNMLAPLTGADRLALEKSRLEAFLNAFPGEYCGFHKDGSVAYSNGFCAMLDLSGIEKVEDIQAALTPTDSAALEGQFLALEQEAKAFSMTVRCDKSGKILRLRGADGTDSDGRDRFLILWAEDVSREEDIRLRAEKAREEAEKQLNLMQGGFDTAPYPAWLRDGTGRILWANKAYSTMLGAVQAEIEPTQIEIIISAKSGGTSPKDLALAALSSGKPQSLHCHVIVGGKRRWMELQETPLLGMLGTVGAVRDATREEELQSELDRGSAAYRGLLEHMRSAVAIFGADQTLSFFNTAWAAQWGLEEQWLNTKPRFGDILEKLRENRKLPEQADFRSWKQGWLDMFSRLIDPHEEMMYLPDGSAVRILIVPHTLGGLMMICEDVTSHLQLESSYNTLIAVQKETLDNLAEGVVVYGGDGRIKLWNPAFSKLWDLNPEEVEGNPHVTKIVDRMGRFFPETGWNDMRGLLIEHALERHEQRGRISRKDDVHLQYTTIPLPDGGVMISYYDITDSARAEIALREKNAALEAAEQLKTDFLANVSYQLRTPLNAIIGFSEILDNQYFGPLNERQTEYTSGIREAGERLISLINDILDLSTIEAGYLELKKEKLHIEPLLQGLYDLTASWAQKKNIKTRLTASDNLPQITADDARLKQAILHLLRNAIHYTPEGGKIDISATQKGDGVEISIDDSGVGIPHEEMQRIFQPFVRTSSTGANATQSGAGLGLALVKSIAELHGGMIAIESDEGKGTKVRVWLPK